MRFKVCLFYHGRAAHHRRFLGAAKKGFARHGIAVEESDLITAVDCDLACFWGHNHTRQRIINRQKEQGRDYLVFERGYIGDRFKWTSVGFNGLNGYAEFHAYNMPNDRWDRFFGDEWLKPWKYSGKHVLICGQVPGDASIKHTDHSKWLREAVALCQQQYPSKKILFRPHPVSVNRGGLKKIEGAETSTGSLAEDLAGSFCAVTFNSNSGVDAVLAGVPAVTMDEGAMAYNITSHKIGKIIRPDRTQWAYNMAYCQWTEEEIANGDAWEHLKRRYQ